MHYLLLLLAVLDLLIVLYVTVQMVRGDRLLSQLRDIPPAADPLPSLSIVVAARNEERDIEAGLQSLLRLDYEPLEVIVVNDRSTDRTGEIVERLARDQTRLRAIHLQELPPGWLGKNHALECGGAAATGEFLLFTDADIVMDPSVARRAIRYMQDHELDQLAAMFKIVMPGWLLQSFAILFSIYFFAYFRPWKVRDPNSPAHIGIGGFNLLRTAAYRRIGTHRAIALRPDDDLKLGKLVKKHGCRADVVLAVELLTVPWYASLGELIRGLEKNAFAGIDYNIPLLVSSSLFALLMHFGPFVFVFVTAGPTRWVWLAVVALLLGMAIRMARMQQQRVAAAFGFPLVVLLFVFIQWRTMVLNLWQGGIRWRDTFYPLAALKANKV